MTFLDVGQGDAVFIQTPSGRQVLVDGGPGESALLAQLGRQMPFWDRGIDVVVLTHSDADHLTGLVPVLARYEVGIVVSREEPAETDLYARWLELVAAEGAEAYQGRGRTARVAGRGTGYDGAASWPRASQRDGRKQQQQLDRGAARILARIGATDRGHRGGGKPADGRGWRNAWQHSAEGSAPRELSLDDGGVLGGGRSGGGRDQRGG